MNKTVTVNIGGIVFHIDENAYERFKSYLESIRSHFSGSEGRDEIMQDIESRIAEMFQDRIKDQKQVITLSDVEEVTAIMGKPEQFGEEEKKDEGPKQNAEEGKIKRRLFRNPDDKLLGGVCSGVAAYFDIDPVWIRLVLAISILFYGTGVMFYIILWIVIPKAITTADKLQMKGEPVTIGNIEKNVQEEMENVKKNFSKLKDGNGFSSIVSKFFDAIIQILKMIVVFIGKVFAFIFVLIGLFMGFVIFASMLVVFKVPGAKYPEVLNQIFPSGFHFSFALLSAALVIGIPFLMLAYFGARKLFNINKGSRIFNLTALGVWVASIIACFILGITVWKDFSQKQSIRKEISLMQPLKGKIILKTENPDLGKKRYDWDEDEWNGDLRLSINDNQLQSRDIKLDIVASPNDSFSLSQIYYARGASKKIAADNATHVSYSFSQTDSLINFNSFFVIEKGEKYRGQKIQLVLQIPIGGRIYIDKTMDNMIYDIDNVNNILDFDMLDRTWEMTKEGLKCVDCTGQESTIGNKDDDIFLHGAGGRVHINDKGVFIKGQNDESVSIDSNGIVIHKNGKTKIIKGGNVNIKTDNDKEWK